MFPRSKGALYLGELTVCPRASTYLQCSLLSWRSAVPETHQHLPLEERRTDTTPVQSALAPGDVASKLKCLSLSNHLILAEKDQETHKSNDPQKRGEWKTHSRFGSKPAWVLLDTLGILWNKVFLKKFVSFELIFFQFILHGNHQPKFSSACRVSACRLLSLLFVFTSDSMAQV